MIWSKVFLENAQSWDFVLENSFFLILTFCAVRYWTILYVTLMYCTVLFRFAPSDWSASNIDHYNSADAIRLFQNKNTIYNNFFHKISSWTKGYWINFIHIAYLVKLSSLYDHLKIANWEILCTPPLYHKFFSFFWLVYNYFKIFCLPVHYLFYSVLHASLIPRNLSKL